MSSDTPTAHQPLGGGARVGVVVPCRDEVATIATALRALRRQQPAPTRVVVVDNGSTDGSLEVARELADEVVELPGASISALRNTGARAVLEHARAAGHPLDVVAFVDADTEVADDWTAAGLRALSGADLVGSRSQAAADAPWVARQWAHVEDALAHSGSLAWSQHLLVRAEAFERLGGFREDLPTGEDADLSARLRESGGTVVLDPDVRAVHHGFPGDLAGFLRRERWHTRAPGWFARMSPKSRLLVLATGGWVVAGGAAAGLAVVGRTRAPLAGWLLASAAGVPALGSLTSRRPVAAAQDGVLVGLWALVRVARLPRELAARGRGGSR